MPTRTSIEWTDFSSNPIRAVVGGRRGWMCAKVSPGCQNCYSEVINGRFGNQADYTVANAREAEHFIAENELDHILKFRPKGPYRGGTIKPKVFVEDMADLFGDWVADAFLDRIFTAMEQRPDVIFQVLTKRAERMHEYLSWRWGPREDGPGSRIPARNIWCGVSAEDQKRADERIPWLLKTPAAVRFVSAEPLLGPIDFTEIRDANRFPGCACFDVLRGRMIHEDDNYQWTPEPKIDWVIVGGESGPKARPFDIRHGRSIVQQCQAAGVPVFYKQYGSRPVEGERMSLDHDRLPIKLRDPKGGDMSEWDECDRVRQFPEAAS